MLAWRQVGKGAIGTMSKVVTIRQVKQALCVLGVGFILGGIFLAIPDTYQSWKFIRENQRNMFGERYAEDRIYRLEEETPTRKTSYKIIQGQAQRKAYGAILIFFGGNLAWFFGQALADEFEIIEKRRWKVRQSEFLIEDTTLRTGTEVEQTMIEMDQLSRLAEYQHGFRSDDIKYLPDDEEPEDVKGEGDGSKYPESPNGFFMWLIDRGFRQAKVRDIAQKSFNNGKLPYERIREYVDGLVSQKLAEWLDDPKSEFRLINVAQG